MTRTAGAGRLSAGALAAVVSIAALAVLAAGCAPAGSTREAQAEAIPSADESAAPTQSEAVSADPLQAELDAWVRDPGEVGVTAALVADDGQWSGAAGVDGQGEPLVPASAMAIGSITKTFTAAEVMLLADTGLVDLDAPVTDQIDLPFDTQGATVRQLLGMRSGFPDPTDEVFVEASADQDQSKSSADWYRLVDTSEMGYRPGVGDPSYNNLNFVALTDLIEAATGQSYADALRQDLLDPAGLDRIWVQDDEKPEPPVAIGTDDPDVPLVDAGSPWLPSRAIVSAAGGAGSLAADAPTVAAWGWTLYTGRLLNPDLLAQMTTAPKGGHYGLGTGIGTDSRGAPIVGHDGDISTYTSSLVVWPDDEVAVVVLSAQGATRPLDSLAIRLHRAWSEH